MSSPFRRILPSRPDLDQLKRQAKELLRAFTRADADALARVRSALPDKPRIVLADAQFVLAREHGFANWAALKAQVETLAEAHRSPEEKFRRAFERCDASMLRQLLERYPAFRQRIDEPRFAFDSPAIVAFADDPAMVEVLLEYGADPNRRSDWWAGGFHALHSATGAAAEQLLGAGAVADACAAAHLDRIDLLGAILSDDPARVHELGGDGQTPLHFARSREVIDLLLDAGADIDARDVDHRASAAEWMLDRKPGAGRYDLARYLVARGATTDIFLAVALGLSDRVRAMLAADPTLLDARTGQGAYAEQPPSSYHIYFWTIGGNRSPLDVALQFEHADLLDVMLDFATPTQRLLLACRRSDATEAKAIVRDQPGLLAALTADDQRAIADAAWQGDARAVALMLELGFDPGVIGHNSGTALHCAAWYGSAETVAVLLGHPGAKSLLAVRDRVHNSTPFGWCCHGSLYGPSGHDHVGVARLLLEAGTTVDEEIEASDAILDLLAARGR